MGRIVLGQGEFRDKVYGCWLGKVIGGTLGAPWECKKFVNDLTFYRPVPTKPAPNDDLDLQLVWLQMLEERGVPPKLPHLAEYWSRYTRAYPWNEYGFCMRNLERGLVPPVSGWFENYYVDEMGSPIRSEIWACTCPADPQRAAALAWMDSAMDHAGGEGACGEMFWAAVQSAAFVVADPLELIQIGLNMIPPACQIARVIREAVWCRQNGRSWSEARERIVTVFGHIQPCNAVPNHGFTILGWLYGQDFGDRLCKAVNCGYDTDCTGATLGATLGILGGRRGIPKRWSDPVGRKIVLHKFTGKINAPKDLDELTDRTVMLARRLLKDSSTVALGNRRTLPPHVGAALMRNEQAVAALRLDLRSAAALAGPLEVSLHYHGDPVIQPGTARRLSISVRCDGETIPADVRMTGPKGWVIAPAGAGSDGQVHFRVEATKVAGRNRLAVAVPYDGRTVRCDFVILGPDEAKGFAAATNVAKCPVCRGREGSCVCVR